MVCFPFRIGISHFKQNVGDFLVGVIKKDGRLYELKSMQNGTYVLFDVHKYLMDVD